MIPIKIAPAVSKIAARTTACLIVNAFDPTEVAKAFAASFAPIPIAVKKAKQPPTTIIQVYIIPKIEIISLD